MKEVKDCNAVANQTLPNARVPIQTGMRSDIPTEHEELRQILRWAELAKNLPVVRRELVDRVKAEIAAGTYESGDKLEAAIERMMDDIE